MANCNICRNLQRDRFGLARREPYRENIMQRRSIVQSAGGCQTCFNIYEAWKARVTGLFRYMEYICLKSTAPGAPLRIFGRNTASAHSNFLGELYNLPLSEFLIQHILRKNAKSR
jgi:hypothetical protein